MIKAALELLSPRIKEACPSQLETEICEIRLRRDMPLCFSAYNGNIFVNEHAKVCKIQNALTVTSEDINFTVNKLSQGSVYRHTENIKKGFIVTPDGIRAGICGTAVYQDDKIYSVDNFTAVNIRVHRHIPDCGAAIIRHILQNGLKSMLIMSPPGVGKTTVIRSIACNLSFSYRVAVVDEKGEIMPHGMVKELGMCDILKGYSKPEGMEIALRMMSPQLMICDEIGMADDIPLILSVQNSGVPLIATAHGKNIEEIKSKPNLKALINSGVFEEFVVLHRRDGCLDTEFLSMKNGI